MKISKSNTKKVAVVHCISINIFYLWSNGPQSTDSTL